MQRLLRIAGRHSLGKKHIRYDMAATPNTPTILDEQQREQKTLIIETLKVKPVVQTACIKAGIVRATYYRWMKTDRAFAKDVCGAIKEGNDLINDMAESKLFDGIKEGKMSAIRYRLDHKHPKYKKKLVQKRKRKDQPQKKMVILIKE